MPMYGFSCTHCGLEFEVSRPMKDAGLPAVCPLDGEAGSRVFTAPARLGARGGDNTPPPAAAPAQPAQSQWSHFGHSHGFGSRGHSHGRPV